MDDRSARRSKHGSTFALLAAVAGLLVALALPASASAISGTACESRTNTTYQALLECVTLDGVRAHQAAFQAIANANNGIRTSGTAGYDQSVEYVRGKLESAGYNVTVQPFDFQTFIELSPSVLEQVAPSPMGPVVNNIMAYSGSGDNTAPVTALPAPPADATPGCEAADFAGFPAGNIALIRRGACTFAVKATNAYNAGASGVVIYNNASGTLNGTLGSTFTLNISVTAVTQAVGDTLAATPGLVLRLKTDTFRGIATTYNVLAETKDGDPSNVVMAGAHLDSVNAGPGINDNGSGSAAILETAIQMAKVKPHNKVRFAWWAAEESGLVGSTYYVNNLSQDERDKIAMYMNYDMVGSPNYIFMVYDANQSSFVAPVVVPPGSPAIEDVYESYYTMVGEPYDDAAFSGRSDYQAFILAGIPSGGLFTGAEGVKTPEQASIWGGTAGQQYDPCYHLACDTFANNSNHALEVNSDLIAFAQLTFAFSTQSVNGVPGMIVPGSPSSPLPAPAGPEGTFLP